MSKKAKRSNKPVKLMIALENDTSGLLDDVAIEATDESGITAAVIGVIEQQNWTLADGDSIRITVIED